jgi:hypothetical protein
LKPARLDRISPLSVSVNYLQKRQKTSTFNDKINYENQSLIVPMTNRAVGPLGMAKTVRTPPGAGDF